MPFYLHLLLAAVALPFSGPGQQTPLPAGTSNSDAVSTTTASLKPVEDAIAREDFVGATSLLDSFLLGNPNNARALFLHGYAAEATGNNGLAEQDYRKAIAASPDQFESHISLGLLLTRVGKTSEARVELKTATNLTPDPPDGATRAAAWRALAYLDARTDSASASAELLEALKTSAETPEDTLLAASLAEAAGDATSAEAAYRKVLGAKPDSVEAATGLAHILLQQQKYAEAEPLLRKALSDNPLDPTVKAKLASLLSATGHTDEAIALIEDLHQAQPANPAITRMLADLYSQAEAVEKADPLYKQLVAAAGPDGPDASLLTAVGNNLIHWKHYAEAQNVLERAVSRQPDLADAWSGLAFASSENHQYSVTVKALTARSKLIADNAATLFLWAISYDNLQQRRLAADFYNRFLAVANGKFPDQEWQAKHRLVALSKSP